MGPGRLTELIAYGFQDVELKSFSEDTYDDVSNEMSSNNFGGNNSQRH